MPPKTVKRALVNVLESLTQKDFDDFIHELLDRREEPQVRCQRVEGQTRRAVADVLVSTFTESGASAVADELLRAIDCSDFADRLAQETSGLVSKAGSTDTAGASAGATGANDVMDDGEHFVDKHRTELINRVSNIASVLYLLLDAKVINQGKYEEILVIPTSRDKMRALYNGPLNSSGNAGKDIFLRILEEEHPLLIAELRRKK